MLGTFASPLKTDNAPDFLGPGELNPIPLSPVGAPSRNIAVVPLRISPVDGIYTIPFRLTPIDYATLRLRGADVEVSFRTDRGVARSIPFTLELSELVVDGQNPAIFHSRLGVTRGKETGDGGALSIGRLVADGIRDNNVIERNNTVLATVLLRAFTDTPVILTRSRASLLVICRIYVDTLEDRQVESARLMDRINQIGLPGTPAEKLERLVARYKQTGLDPEARSALELEELEEELAMAAPSKWLTAPFPQEPEDLG